VPLVLSLDVSTSLNLASTPNRNLGSQPCSLKGIGTEKAQGSRKKEFKVKMGKNGKEIMFAWDQEIWLLRVTVSPGDCDSCDWMFSPGAQAIAQEIYADLVEDSCLGFCFEVHRAVKCGYFFLDDTDPDSMKDFGELQGGRRAV
jgi:hypothetical protein